MINRERSVFLLAMLLHVGCRALPCLPYLMQDGRTPLDCTGSIECITALLDAGATLASPEPGSRTHLHIAAICGSEALVRRLLAASDVALHAYS